MRMGRWRTVGTVISVSQQQARLGSSKVSAQPQQNKWRKLFIPLKATKILSRAQGNGSYGGVMSKKPGAKPNPPFKRESWKKSPSTTTKSPSTPKNVSGKVEKLPSVRTTKSILRKKDSGQITKNARVRISDKPSVYRKPSKSKSSNINSNLTKTTNKKHPNIEKTLDDKKFDSSIENVKNPSESKLTEKVVGKNWRKIRLMLNYLKIRNPGIVTLSKSDSDANASLAMNLKAIQMVDKFKEMSSRSKNAVPRCGGKRNPGDFDYLGIYQRHKIVQITTKI